MHCARTRTTRNAQLVITKWAIMAAVFFLIAALGFTMAVPKRKRLSRQQRAVFILLQLCLCWTTSCYSVLRQSGRLQHHASPPQAGVQEQDRFETAPPYNGPLEHHHGIIATAMANYELFHGMEPGTATIHDFFLLPSGFILVA